MKLKHVIFFCLRRCLQRVPLTIRGGAFSSRFRVSSPVYLCQYTALNSSLAAFGYLAFTTVLITMASPKTLVICVGWMLLRGFCHLSCWLCSCHALVSYCIPPDRCICLVLPRLRCCAELVKSAAVIQQSFLGCILRNVHRRAGHHFRQVLGNDQTKMLTAAYCG